MRHSLKRLVLFSCVCLTPLLSPAFLKGQSIGRMLEKGDSEVGYTERLYERNFSNPFYPSTDWGERSLFVRIGLTNWLTPSLEGYDFKRPQANFPERDYKEYHVGLGIATQLWTAEGFYFLLDLHYDETLNQDRSLDRWDKLDQNFFGSVEIQKHFSIKPIDCAVFAGPAFVWDEFDNIPPPPFRIEKSVSIHNLGFAAGLDFLVFKHIHVITQYVYADYWQYRFAVGYIF